MKQELRQEIKESQENLKQELRQEIRESQDILRQEFKESQEFLRQEFKESQERLRQELKENQEEFSKKILDQLFVFEHKYSDYLKAMFDSVILDRDKNIEKSEKITDLEQRVTQNDLKIFAVENRVDALEAQRDLLMSK